MSLSERIHDLNREIGATVERAIAELRQEISQRLRSSNEEIQQRLEDLSPALPSAFLSDEEFAHTEREVGTVARRRGAATRRAGRSRSQAEILTALLRESARYASRAAVLLVRGGEVRGWGSEGFGDAETSMRQLVLDANDGPWNRLVQGHGAVRLSAGECAGLCSRVESRLPREGVLVPLVLRDRVAAGLYADRLDGDELGVEALQILAHGAAQAIETLPFRERAATATLAIVEEEGATGEPAAPPAQEPELAAEQAAAPAEVSPVRRWRRTRPPSRRSRRWKRRCRDIRARWRRSPPRPCRFRKPTRRLRCCCHGLGRSRPKPRRRRSRSGRRRSPASPPA